MSTANAGGIISTKSFLVVDSERSVLDQFERYLLMEAAHKVYTATSPLQALRILQDRRTPVDCVICPNKRGKISGIEFLENLRAGRWGTALRDVCFILTLKDRDNAVIRRADGSGVSGYILGELDRTSVIETISNVLSGQPVQGPLRRYGIAHLRLGSADVILVPIGGNFGGLDAASQSRVHQQLSQAAAESGLSGVVVPVWETGTGMGFLAPTSHHGVLSALTFDFARKSINRTLSLESELPLTAEYQPKPAAASSAKTSGGAGHAAGAGHSASQNAGAAPGATDLAAGNRDFSYHKSADSAHALEGADTHATTEETHAVGVRSMSSEDIGKVILAYRQLGPDKFVKAFLRSQSTFAATGGRNFVPEMEEYYFSLDALRKGLFSDVDLRKSGKFMAELTLALDQAMMRSIKYIPNLSANFSINLNIQSVFTPTFENFLHTAPTDRMTIEFRQPNIVEHYDEFVTARALLESKGIKMIVDRIFPDTFGLVNLDYIGAHTAKLNWTGVERWQDLRVNIVRRVLDAGISVVVSRVDDPSALDLTAQVGITHLQGFYIDRVCGHA